MAKSCKKHLDLLEYSIARTCNPSYWLKKGTNYPQITELKSTNHGKIIYILRNFQEILCNSTNYLYLCPHIIQAYKVWHSPTTSSPSTRRWRVEGEEERAIIDRADALSYDMSPFQGYTSELLRLLNCVHSILVVTYI